MIQCPDCGGQVIGLHICPARRTVNANMIGPLPPDDRDARIRVLELQFSELRLHAQRAAGQLRAALELGLYAPESFAHVRASYESIKYADQPVTENPVSQALDAEATELMRDAKAYRKASDAIRERPNHEFVSNPKDFIMGKCGIFVPEVGWCIADLPCKVHGEKRKDD